MTFTIPQEKLTEIASIVADWQGRNHTNVHDLKALLGKLFFISQCYPQARFYLNSMLDILRACPETGEITFSAEFQKYLNWVVSDLLDTMVPINLHVDACSTGAGATCQPGSSNRKQGNPFCHFEAVNAVAALQTCAPRIMESAYTCTVTMRQQWTSSRQERPRCFHSSVRNFATLVSLC